MNRAMRSAVRKLPFICCLFLAAGCLAADDWIQKIRPEHPRLFFNRDTWPEIRARAEGSARQAWEDLRLAVEKYPDEPVCCQLS